MDYIEEIRFTNRPGLTKPILSYNIIFNKRNALLSLLYLVNPQIQFVKRAFKCIWFDVRLAVL